MMKDKSLNFMLIVWNEYDPIPVENFFSLLLSKESLFVSLSSARCGWTVAQQFEGLEFEVRPTF